MKTVKKILLSTTLFGIMTFTFVGFNNSIVVNKTSFLDNRFSIKFAKRLDEMNGEVTFGRMAASLPKFDPSKSLSAVQLKKEEKQVVKGRGLGLSKTPEKKEEPKKIIDIPEPAIVDARGLVLTGGLYDKKPLEKKHVFSGSASVVDGVLEDVSVSLPDGKGFSLNTSDRMVGNVFQYEDTETREIKSGLFYKIKDGHYMITLTDDTNFPGLRLEFKSEEKEPEFDSSWAMSDENHINSEDEYAQQEAQESQVEWNTYTEEINEQAFNDSNKELYNQEFEQAQNYPSDDEIDQAFDEMENEFIDQETVDASQSYGFKFQS